MLCTPHSIFFSFCKIYNLLITAWPFTELNINDVLPLVTCNTANRTDAKVNVLSDRLIFKLAQCVYGCPH